MAQVFEAMERSLSWVEGRPGEAPPAWLDAPGGADLGERYLAKGANCKAELRVRIAAASEADEVVDRIMALEEAIFEPARRDPEERLRLGFDSYPDGVVVLAEAGGEGGWALGGYAVATPLERVATTGLARTWTLWWTATRSTRWRSACRPTCRGRGLGRWIKAAQVEHARKMKRANGEPRFPVHHGAQPGGLDGRDAADRLDVGGARRAHLGRPVWGGRGAGGVLPHPAGASVLRGGVPQG